MSESSRNFRLDKFSTALFKETFQLLNPKQYLMRKRCVRFCLSLQISHMIFVMHVSDVCNHARMFGKHKNSYLTYFLNKLAVRSIPFSLQTNLPFLSTCMPFPMFQLFSKASSAVFTGLKQHYVKNICS